MIFLHFAFNLIIHEKHLFQIFLHVPKQLFEFWLVYTFFLSILIFISNLLLFDENLIDEKLAYHI